VAPSESLSHTEARLSRPGRPVPRDEDGRLPHESEFLSQLGGRVREMRALHGMSRRELARLSGLSERFVAQIEAGKGNVSRWCFAANSVGRQLSPSAQLRARFSTFAIRSGTPNSLRHTSASTATPSRICSCEGLAKHSRSRLPA
jgi:DNA-binding XRE family transcriptional regulator